MGIVIEINGRKVTTFLVISKKNNSPVLLKGFGLRSTIHKYDWKEQNKADIICSMFDRKQGTTVFINKVTNAYIIGHAELAKVLGVFSNFKSPDVRAIEYLKKNSLKDLINISVNKDMLIEQITD